MSGTWLNTRELAAWRNFVSALGPLMDSLETDLAPHGLTLGDYEVLEARRSLNLANAAGIALFEALRRIGAMAPTFIG